METIASDRPVKKIVVAICGASGSVYGIRLVEEILKNPVELHLAISSSGKVVMAHETEYSGGTFIDFLEKRKLIPHEKASLKEYEKDDLFAPPASGSFRHDGMAVAPCSMNTLGAISSGIADDLIRRAADVSLKERRTLVLLTRETPLSAIHLENMLRLSRAGAVIMPACPGFYRSPESVDQLVDTVVARMLEHLGLGQRLVKPWGGKGDKPVHV
jgi:4-hydroxy-3-polyprenylbenzoate decarboxylase